ncbi:hypothetical protein KIS4809_2205 [Bacillus sp. ZZV12-4809]|nr:hypothetical protein KIS4809_2205 [Bacillus sp. ZZV12-4809]
MIIRGCLFKVLREQRDKRVPAAEIYTPASTDNISFFN